MLSPIQYFGGKMAIADELVALMPQHEGYIEPYGGSLAVLLAKAPSKIEVVNDLDQTLMTFWRVLRDRPEDLQRVCELTPHAKAELDTALALDADDELELARQVWVVLTQGRSRTLRRTGWRVDMNPAVVTSRRSGFAKYLAPSLERLAPVAERLRDVSLECRPALELIAKYGAHASNLLYVDPPYEHTTRASARYVHEMHTPDHEALAAALRACKATVMLSGYHSALYEELYADWFVAEIPAHTANGTDPDRLEVVWSNRDLRSYLFSMTAGGGGLLVWH